MRNSVFQYSWVSARLLSPLHLHIEPASVPRVDPGRELHDPLRVLPLRHLRVVLGDHLLPELLVAAPRQQARLLLVRLEHVPVPLPVVLRYCQRYLISNA